MKLMAQTRNIGISAHIDSGKTTLTERILFYCDKIHKIEEVKGGGSGATMDFMDLEREKGITITSAATTVQWEGSREGALKDIEGDDKGVKINIIDTPGHVDFTVEVERSLRVLDGAILVLCSVAGVQSQSITVDRQMRRYGVPRLAFCNKLDRKGASVFRAVTALKDKLGINSVLMQLPIGEEENFIGLIDLVVMKAFYFDGENGEILREEAIPADYVQKAAQCRESMLDALSFFDDALTELLLDGKDVPADLIYRAVYAGVNSLQLVPVYCGSAFKNKGVQLLLDAIARFLPSPLSRKKNQAIDNKTNSRVFLEPDPKASLVCMAFKITDDAFGQLTYTRIYQGTLRKGDVVYNTRTQRKIRVGRLVRMHADERETIEEAMAGDIVAMVGVDCASGDTFVGDENHLQLSCEGMHVPLPVIELSVRPKDKDHQERMSKGLARFMKEDPTFHVFTDAESGETRMAGMGELHLEIYVERLSREYKAIVEVGAPQVNYRETITSEAKFSYTHKKQTGGSGQYAQVIGEISPLTTENKENEAQVFKFLDEVKGGAIPTEYIGACEKGFQDVMDRGPLAAFPMIDVQVNLQDGKSHDVDSSDLAFRIASRMALRGAVRKASPKLLEPIMKVEIETPDEYQGTVIGDISARRGIIQQSEAGGPKTVVINALVPLSSMFGYATGLRSMTAGKASYTMEFSKYAPCPLHVAEKVIEDRKDKLAERA
jgi:elongation factor G